MARPGSFRPKVPAGMESARARSRRYIAEALERRFGRRPPRPDVPGEPCPVEPDRPLDLSGGAAAALEFDA